MVVLVVFLVVTAVVVVAILLCNNFFSSCPILFCPRLVLCHSIALLFLSFTRVFKHTLIIYNAHNRVQTGYDSKLANKQTLGINQPRASSNSIWNEQPQTREWKTNFYFPSFSFVSHQFRAHYYLWRWNEQGRNVDVYVCVCVLNALDFSGALHWQITIYIAEIVATMPVVDQCW